MDLSLPASPGIYRFYNKADQLIYVGKAKNLRRRLAQYKNAKRCKAHAKMRKIVKEAKRIEHEVCATEYEALCLETQWIQKHRPKWNVAGAFFFLYPMVGLSLQEGHLYFCYTTTPELFPNFQFHGAFRSRERTRDGFFALIELLGLIGHSAPRAQLVKLGIYPSPEQIAARNAGRLAPDEEDENGTDDEKNAGNPNGETVIRKVKRPGYVYGFRQLPEHWTQGFNLFFRGEDFSIIPELALLLLERPTAVAKSKEIEDFLHVIRRLWRHEILPLRKACKNSAWEKYPVSQQDRDLLFIALRSRQNFSNP